MEIEAIKDQSQKVQHCELVQYNVYAVETQNAKKIQYYQYNQETQYLKEDSTISLNILKLLEDDYHYEYYQLENDTVDIKVSDLLLTNIEAEQIIRNINGVLHKVVKIPVSENERLVEEEIVNQEELEKKKKMKQEEIERKRKRYEEEQKEKERKKKEFEDTDSEEERLKAEEEERKKKIGKTDVRNPNFKKGLYNKGIKEIQETSEQECGNTNKFNYECSVNCAGKELIRAAKIGNLDLVKEILNSKEKIHSLFVRYGVDRDMNFIETIFQNNDKEMLKYVIDFIQNGKKKYASRPHNNLGTNQYCNNKYNGYFEDRGFITNVSQNYYGEGQNPLAYDQYYENEFSDYMMSRLFTFDCNPELFDMLRILVEYSLDDKINNQIGLAVRCGNRKLAAHLMNFASTKRSGWGYNQLHEDVLTKDTPEEVTDFKTISIMKNPLSAVKINPLQCACINPNPDVLERLLKQQDQSQFIDDFGLRLVHYAAACVGPGPLELLVTKYKLNPKDFIPKNGNNSLHIAAQYGRAKTIEFLLSNPDYFDLQKQNNFQQCPIHLACLSNDLNSVQILIEKGTPVDQQGEIGMQVLHYAATQGNMEIIEYLVKNFADINAQDNKGRTPLIYAIRNNNVAAISYLLQKGADYSLPDNDNNYPLHYAAGYGFYESVLLLFKAGCQLNYTNSANNTALAVAYLKSHNKVVNQLLNFQGIDLNCIIMQQKTILYLEIEQFFNFKDDNINIEEKIEKIELLLKKRALPNKQGYNGNTPLHLICENNKHQIKQIALKDPEHPDNQKTNPFYIERKKALGLEEDQNVPQNDVENRIYYEEAKNSQQTKEIIDKIDREKYQSDVSFLVKKEQVIEEQRQLLMKKKRAELHKKYEEKTVLKLVKLLLQYKAKATAIVNHYHSSPAQLALDHKKSKFSVFKALIEHSRKIDLSIGFTQPGVYHQLVQYVNQRNRLEHLHEVFQHVFKYDRHIKNNINLVDNQGFSPLIKLFMNYKVYRETIKDINGNDVIQTNIDQFKDLVQQFIAHGADPHFKVQRNLNQRSIKGANREQKDENYDMTQELEAREKRLQDEFDEEEENAKIVPEYVKLTKNAHKDYCKEGEQNLFSIIINYQQDFIQDLYPILFDNKVNITNRDCYNRTPFHFYLQKIVNIKLEELDLFLNNMKFPHLFRYQDSKGDTFIHTFLDRASVYKTPKDQEKTKYQSALVKKLFFIKGISKLFKITNAQGEHPLMILLKQSQSSSEGQDDPYFQELLKIDEVIESITETQDNNWSCLHSLFQKKIVNVENLNKLLKSGGCRLLDTQVSYKERHGKGKSYESENLQTPIHVLIANGHIRKNILKCILSYFEGRKSLKLKDIQGKNPLFYLVERGYGQNLIKDLIVPNQINDLSKVSPYMDRQSVLNAFLQAYSENDSSCEALRELLRYGADVNFIERKDQDDRTLIVKTLEMKKFRFAEVLFQNGIDINQIFKYYEYPVPNTEKETDFYHVTKSLKSFLNPLLFSIKLQDEELLKNLILNNKADPNIRDPFNRTALHHALNYSNCKADTSFEIENIVLQNGCKLSLDDKKRSPLHYCFVKFDNDRPNYDFYKYKQADRFIDPIQSLSSLCAGEENNDILLQQDIYGKTVIHYCAIRNSAMCLRFLLKKKQDQIDINQVDIYGNTPLTLAFLNKSMEVAQILIQNGGNTQIKAICLKEDPFTQIEMQSKEEKTEYNLFNLALQYNWQGICSLLIEFKYDLWEAYQTAINNTRFKLARSLLFKSQQQQNQKDGKGHNMMHIFALKGSQASKNMQKKIYQELIKRDLDLQIQDVDGFSPIHLAVLQGFNYLAKHLAKDCKVNLNQPENIYKKTAMHVIVDNNEFKLLDQIVKAQSKEIDYNCQLLHKQLKKKEKPEDQDEYEFIPDQTLLHKLFAKKQIDILEYIFNNAFDKLDFKVKDRFGKTVLHYMSNYVAGEKYKIIKKEKKEGEENQEQEEEEKEEEVKTQEQLEQEQKTKNQLTKMLDYHPDLVNIQDLEKRTPLYYAISNSHNFLVKVLADYNSDLNNEIGEIIKQKDDYFPYFIKTCQPGQIDFARRQEKTENTLLHLAIMHDQVCIFDKLPLDYDLESKNSEGNTPLILAGELQKPEFYRKIIELGADINAQNKEGMSFLHRVCINGDLEGIDLAIKNKANIQIRNNIHQTPMSLALANKNYVSMAKILFETDIDVSSECLIEINKKVYTTNPQLYVDQPQKDSLLENYKNGDLKGYTQFIYEAKEVKVKKLKHDHWKFVEEKDQYYHEISFEVTTVKITSMLLYLIHKKIAQRSSYFKKPAKQTEKEKKMLKDNQREFYPEIPSPEGQQIIMKCLQRGQNPCLKDQNKQFILFKAISKNDNFLAKVLLKFIKPEQIKDFVDDKNGKNPVHYCVEPVSYGSYQNTNLLQTIIKKGFDVNHKDKADNTPCDLAFQQDQTKMLKVLQENKGIRTKKQQNIQKSFTSVIGSVPWGNEIMDIEKDSESYKEFLTLKHKSQRVYDSSPHPSARNVASLSISDNLDLCTDRYGYYDVLLTKLDDTKEQWGTYVYYQIQLLYCNNKRVYIVFVNQGDIGAKEGEYSATVYQKKSEAIRQFSQLFEEKTGNFWRKKNNKYFKKQEGFYNYYQPIEKMSYDSKVQSFNFYNIENDHTGKGAAKYNIQEDIKEIFKEILNLENIQESFRKYNLETDLFNIDTEILNEASKILEELRALTIELQEEKSNNLIDVDMEKVVDLKNEICYKSNEYYSLIPERGFTNKPQPVLDDLDQIEKKEYMLNALKLLEKTAKLIYGAHSLYHFKNVHPSDYIYRALYIRMHKIEQQHSENKLIMKYIRNSSQTNIQRIYALERKGEAERISRHLSVKNRVILFYPCSDIDILPILANGIQITLPGLQSKQISKNSFGPGIYFTDAFEACMQYFNNNNSWNNVQDGTQNVLKKQKKHEQFLKQVEKDQENIKNVKEDYEIDSYSDSEDNTFQPINNNNTNDNQFGNMNSDTNSFGTFGSSNIKFGQKKVAFSQPAQPAFGNNFSNNSSFNNNNSFGTFGSNNTQSYNQFGSNNNNSNKHKYVLLCEVVLGESMKMRSYKEIDNLDINYQSIKGEGKFQPSDSHNIILSNGCVFPSGNLQRVDLEEQRKYLNMTDIERLKYKPLNFNYNQYVVHDESQIRIRYIVQI